MDGDRFGPTAGGTAQRGIPLSGRLLFGAVAITLGVLWTAENLGLVDADAVLRYWPALLLVFGFLRVTGSFGPRHVVSGVLFMVAGGWMLARELDLIQISIFRLWPVFLIFMGASLVWRSMRGEAQPVDPQRDSYPRPVALMGGVTRAIESQDLIGIEASAVMGGVELDLRGAKARGSEVIVEVFAWWGGIDLVVPDHWRVVTEVTPVMGGVDDQTRVAVADPVTTLVVRGVVIMGGIELRNTPSNDSTRRVRVAGSRFASVTVGRADPKDAAVKPERDPGN